MEMLNNMPHQVNTVIAVIVIYHPQSAALLSLIDAIGPQVAQVVVVDNGGTDGVREQLRLREIAWLAQVGNQGLAAGLNIGIAHALRQNATHVILFDQDSLPPPSLVSELLAAERALLARDIRVAAVGPVFRDVKSGMIAPITGFEWCYTRKKRLPDFDRYIEAGYLISSGQLIRQAMLMGIGLMRADLFIDGIDIEWSLRARQQGFRSFAVTDVTMAHNLGDRSVQIAGSAKPLHGPLRHYYIIRNALLLCRSKQIAGTWKMTEILKTLRRLIAYAIFCQHPLQHIKWMMRGLHDGVRGIAGQAHYPDDI
jgi:rhamnosyltransferase